MPTAAAQVSDSTTAALLPAAERCTVSGTARAQSWEIPVNPMRRDAGQMRIGEGGHKCPLAEVPAALRSHYRLDGLCVSARGMLAANAGAGQVVTTLAEFAGTATSAAPDANEWLSGCLWLPDDLA